jgi:hypothetical protein
MQKGRIGLDVRHEDLDGRIDRKHSNALNKNLSNPDSGVFAQCDRSLHAPRNGQSLAKRDSAGSEEAEVKKSIRQPFV